LRVYLDACCLSRLTDDQRQERVRAEAEAVENTLRMAGRGLSTWVSSTVLEIELSRNPDEADRARQLKEHGFGPFDALHLASAEKARVDVFLTTDDDLLRRAHRNPGLLHISVMNPVSWYQEERS
jgi:predicted nucleic acid-binding protein